MAEKSDMVSSLVENKIVLLIARVAMPMVVALLVFLGKGWLDDIDDLSKKIIIIEQKLALSEDNIRRWDNFQVDTLKELHDIQNTIDSLALKVSALEATIQTLRDRAEASPPSIVRQAEPY